MLKKIKQELAEMENMWERRSYKVIITSAIMISIGLLLGSFIKYTVILASTGAFVLLIGIVLYIYSQLIEKDKTSQVNTNFEEAEKNNPA